MASVFVSIFNPKTYIYALMYLFLLFMVGCIFVVGYAAMLTFKGSCEVMMEERLKSEEEVFFTRKGKDGEVINLDEIAGIGFMGIAMAFVWSIIFDLISRLSNAKGFFGSIGVFLRQVAFAATAALPVIAYAISIPNIDEAQNKITKLKSYSSTETSVCKAKNDDLKNAERDKLTWKSVKYGALMFGVGLLVAISMLKFMQFYIRIAGCVPWGLYCLMTLIITIACLAYSGRFYYANKECCNRIAKRDDEKLRNKLKNKKGLDYLFAMEAPCDLLKKFQAKKTPCLKKIEAMKNACTADTVLTAVFISLSVIAVVALIMFILGVSYLSEIAWVCIP